MSSRLVSSLAVLLCLASPAHALELIEGGRIGIGFTTPGVSAQTAQDPIVDDEIVALIASATATLDLALYDLDHPPFVDAITAAADRGVTVRLVGDLDEADQAGYVALAAAGVPMVLRPGGTIMHDKFVVVDGRWVLTGSMNFSSTGALMNNNNVVVFDDALVAAHYTTELEQMFVDGAFGRAKSPFAHTPVAIGQTTVELAFGPQDDPELALRDAIASADHSIHFMIFSFTRADVAADLIAARQSGVEVVGIFDRFGATSAYSTDETLAREGVSVLLDGNENTYGAAGGKLHHKVMIIDAGTDSDPLVVTGSFNWSAAASNDNDENLVILRGAAAIAPFMRELCEVYDAALPHPDNLGALADPCADDAPWQDPPPPAPTPTPVTITASGSLAAGEWHVIGAFEAVAGTFDVRMTGTGDADLYVKRDAAPTTASYDCRPYSAHSQETCTLSAPGTFHVAVRGYRAATFALTIDYVALVDGPPAPAPADVRIVELLADPHGTDLGQEYLVLENLGGTPADLAGWTLADAITTRHTFAPGTVLEPGHIIVLFDRGDHADVSDAIVSSSGMLSLNNTGDTVTLRDADGATRDAITYGAVGAGVVLERGEGF